MYFKVKVYANAKKNEAIKKSDDSYIIYTKKKAEQGEANEAVKEMLSTLLHVPLGKLLMIKGSKQPNKIFELRK
ncbi:hypothetical protein COZ40_00825 [Candidatus Roizmanbacteria bacterium CG_4_10_14_3_um_filter_39_13]|uniref:DUF167 domain-containing protein n=1 Tax=Candidatus Roizmanbacteria bacterium CG_4_10_14_3_um_filter_39_13 TaxID=1974831 RepID=A0A2M7LLH0_9BACT|nr:MAG: hypothetical protein COZ40_00825 [Candidatus Roizmanbacteria bacterium CG_4_10_14_3_um_filter_39_13]